jgi:plastocyanin
MKGLLRLSILLGVAAVAAPSSAAGKTLTVYAGGPPSFAKALHKKYPAAGISNFLIQKVVIHVGDSVSWNGKSLQGGFHTVDIPALHSSDLSLLVPTGKPAMENDAAGNPFWFSGKLPELGFNHALFGASGGNRYNGTARVDSGLPLSPKPQDFVVKFTKPGTFNYFCDVHYGMGGQIVVKNKRAAIPTARQNATTLAHEERSYFKQAAAVLKTQVKADTVSLGLSGSHGLEMFAMFPSRLTVKAGTTVQFTVSSHTRQVHTASFGPPTYRDSLAASFNTAVPEPAAIFPSDPPGSINLGPTSHGNGFASTGGLDRDAATPLAAVGAIKFTTPGTYDFECLIHPFMRGQIVVTQ